MAYKNLQLRRDTAAIWTNNNPTLLIGEIGYETDTNKIKIGDGSTAWDSLSYLSGVSGVDTSGTPEANDYARFTDVDTIEGRNYSEVKTDLSLNLVENTALSTWAGSTNITTLGTIATVGNITIANGGTIGQAAGPLLTFDDTNDYLEITGCNVGIGTTTPTNKLYVNALADSNDGINIGDVFRLRNSTSGNHFVLEHLPTTGDLYIRSSVGGDTNGNLILNDTGGNVGIGAIIPVAKLAVNGGVNVGTDTDPGDNNIYVVGDCSALTFTDRTPFYAGNALAEIKKIKGKNGKIDHSTLPEFARSRIKLKHEDPNDPNTIIESVEEGRNLGSVVSMLTVAVQQLTERIEVLESKK